jgi:hypothetical protein
MASGMLTKQATFATSKYLNDVNDAAGGPFINTVPGSIAPQFDQDYPGDRILVDDITAAAISDTTIGTLYGGIYEYVLTLSSSTAAPARGTAAFFRAADIGSTAGLNYQVSADANPSTTVPTYFAGVFISAVTKGNQGWVQIAGIASCLFDSSVTANTTGNWVSVKVSASVASTFDVGAAVGVVTLSALVGTSVGTVATSTISKVGIWRGFGRI